MLGGFNNSGRLCAVGGNLSDETLGSASNRSFKLGVNLDKNFLTL